MIRAVGVTVHALAVGAAKMKFGGEDRLLRERGHHGEAS
jgi:hypothetical protein